MHPIKWLYENATFVQTLASIITAFSAVTAFLISLKATRLVAEQTSHTSTQLSATFRPIIEVLGGSLHDRIVPSKLDLINKGQGAATNFRWRNKAEAERWYVTSTNVVAPGEKFVINADLDWRGGLTLNYNSAANNDEIETKVSFGPASSVSNEHSWQGVSAPRQGWTRINPSFAQLAFHPDFIASKPLHRKIFHWLRLKVGKERRL